MRGILVSDENKYSIANFQRIKLFESVANKNKNILLFKLNKPKNREYKYRFGLN